MLKSLPKLEIAMKKLLATLVVAVMTLGLFAEEEDNTSAIIKLLNSRSAESPKAYLAAAREVLEQAESGQILQQYILGVVALEDARLAKDLGLSSEKCKRYVETTRPKIQILAEDHGNGLAWYLLSIEKNDPAMLKRGADANNVQALNAYGTYKLNEVLTSPTIKQEDYKTETARSFLMFSKAAAMKDANGLYNLGTCYVQGYGCTKDMDLALDCFRSASELGHPGAINNLGGFYRDGIIVRKDVGMAFKWFEKAAQLGNAYGQLNLGLAYQRGEGVAADVEKAAELFKASADQGNPEAMDAYGACLFKGQGVKKNAPLAVRYFRASARFGFAPAMDNLSICYTQGEGVRKDKDEALVWQIRARAARGDRNAAIWLNTYAKPQR